MYKEKSHETNQYVNKPRTLTKWVQQMQVPLHNTCSLYCFYLLSSTLKSVMTLSPNQDKHNRHLYFDDHQNY